MSKMILIAALLTVGVGLRLKPMTAGDSPNARGPESQLSLAGRASRDRARRSYLVSSVVLPRSTSNQP